MSELLTEEGCELAAGKGAEWRDVDVDVVAVSSVLLCDDLWRCFFELLSPSRSPGDATESAAVGDLRK